MCAMYCPLIINNRDKNAWKNIQVLLKNMYRYSGAWKFVNPLELS